MDAVISPGGTLLWPLDDVIIPQQIQPHELGVLAWRASGGSEQRIYVPVLAQGPGCESTLEAQIYVYVRSMVDLEDIQWRLLEQREGVLTEVVGWTFADNPTCVAGRSIRIALPPVDCPQVCIEVAARNRTTQDWLKQTATLMIRGQAE